MIEEFPLVSIIVPVYNVESYLVRCLDSLIHQEYKNLEIILVNDGSTDSSLRICQEYLKKDQRIKLITQDNQGLSMARNKGLDFASGQYLCFVDSDDWVEKDYVSFAMKLIILNQSDICCFAYYLSDGYYKDRMPKVDLKGNVINCDKLQAQKLLARDIIIASHVWDKLYKKELFNDIRFPQNMTYEDVYIMHEVIDKCNRITYSLEPKYYYFERNDSIARSYNNKHILDFLKSELIRYKFYKEKYDDVVGIQSAKMMELVLSYYPRFDFSKNEGEINQLEKMVDEICSAYDIEHDKFKNIKFNVLHFLFKCNRSVYRRFISYLI